MTYSWLLLLLLLLLWGHASSRYLLVLPSLPVASVQIVGQLQRGGIVTEEEEEKKDLHQFQRNSQAVELAGLLVYCTVWS